MFLSVVANKCFYFREDVEKAKSSGDWKTVYDFYLTTLIRIFRPQKNNNIDCKHLYFMPVLVDII